MAGFVQDAQQNSWNKCDSNNSLDDFQSNVGFLNMFFKAI